MCPDDGSPVSRDSAGSSTATATRTLAIFESGREYREAALHRQR